MGKKVNHVSTADDGNQQLNALTIFPNTICFISNWIFICTVCKLTRSRIPPCVGNLSICLVRLQCLEFLVFLLNSFLQGSLQHMYITYIRNILSVFPKHSYTQLTVAQAIPGLSFVLLRVYHNPVNHLR